jgi:hypothetical protein
MPRGPALQALFVASGAITLHKLDLQMVQRIQIRETIADRAREQRVLFQQVGLARDREQRVDARLPFTNHASTIRQMRESRVRHPGKESCNLIPQTLLKVLAILEGIRRAPTVAPRVAQVCSGADLTWQVQSATVDATITPDPWRGAYWTGRRQNRIEKEFSPRGWYRHVPMM